MSKNHSFLSASVLLGMAQAIMLVCTYGINILIARQLGPVEYGHFAVITTILFIMYPFVQSGAPTLVKIYIASGNYDEFSVLRKVRFFQIILGSIVIFITFIFVNADLIEFSSKVYFLLLIVFFEVPLSGLLFSHIAFFNGRLDYKRQFFVISSHSLLRLLLVLILIWSGFGIQEVIIAYLVSTFIIVVVSWPKGLISRGGAISYREIIGGAFLLIIYNFSLVLFQNIGVIIVQVTTNEPVLTGVFQSGNMIGKIAQFVGVVLIMVLFPILSKLIAQKNYEEVKTFVSKAVVAALIVLLPLTTLLIFTSDVIVQMVYGGEFSLAAPIIPILFAGFGFGALLSILGNIAIVLSKMNIALSIGIGLALITSVMSFNLALKYGFEGVAWGMFLSAFLVLLVSIFVMFEYFNIKLLLLLLRKLTLSFSLFLLVVFIGEFFQLPIFPILLISTLVYVYTLIRQDVLKEYTDSLIS